MSPTEPPDRTKLPATVALPQTTHEEPSREPDSEQSEKLTAKAKPRRIVRVIHEAVRQELEFFSGPVPPPNLLIEYNKVFPGCGKEIVEMARQEQNHRHQMDDRQIDGDFTLAKRGQLIGGALALVAVAGAIYLLAHDKSITGLSVLGTVVLAFGGAFVYDRYQRAQSSKSARGGKPQEHNLPATIEPEPEDQSPATQN